MKLTESDIADIVQLLRDADFDDLELEWGDIYLRVAQRSTMREALVPTLSTPEPAPSLVAPVRKEASPPAIEESTPAVASGVVAPMGVVEVRSALMGTVYRSPQPGDPAFVEVGSEVGAGDTLCLLEVMKVFTAVQAETSGVIERILISDGDLVQYNQVIFWIRPV